MASDNTEYEWVLCLDGNPVDYGDDRAALREFGHRVSRRRYISRWPKVL
jgi:hypothetical protein